MTRQELHELIRCSLFDEQDIDSIMKAVDSYLLASYTDNLHFTFEGKHYEVRMKPEVKLIHIKPKKSKPS